MDDQPDDKLKQRIKEVFDNYDDASADAGWLQLREKFPEQRRRRAVLWLWPAAAVLLLFLGLAIWMFGIDNRQADNKKISYHIKTIPSSKPTLLQQKTVVAYEKKADIKHRSTGNPAYKIAGNKAQVKLTTANSTTTVASKQNSVIAKQAAPVNSPVTHPSQPVTIPKTKEIAAIPADTTKKIAIPNAVGLIANAQQKAAAPDTPAKAFAAIKPKTAKTIDDLFAADQGKKRDDLKANKDNKVRFGVYAATYFNYAKGSNNQVNAGAGFTADIVLTGNLKLVTGLSVNQNSFAYNNSGGFDSTFPAPAIYGNGSSGNTTYTQNASLIGLDIPLDLKYVLNSRKNQVYVLAGVGSGTFINESYSYLNSNGSTAASLQSGKGFNDFYFARTLNMALGVGYPLGKDQIVIEPFVKYPLQGLGAEQLRFGASGINLKFNFSIKK